MKMKVIIDGVVAEREVDCINKPLDDSLNQLIPYPDFLVPVLRDNEEIQRDIEGNVHILQMWR